MDLALEARRCPLYVRTHISLSKAVMNMELWGDDDGDHGDGDVDGDGKGDEDTWHLYTTTHYEGLTSRWLESLSKPTITT